ncbi:hypothetical protein ACFY62_28960, partial [Streptomyces sp. NPDC012793]|uniref:hypothetical protein n=1 Tax=unclassified Streptomyces TaxID=2593676 RepID=UPI003688D665
LALIFGTLLSSQGADASFVPVSRPSGRFLRFQLSRSDFLLCHPLERAAGIGIRFRAFRFLGGVKHYQAFSGLLTTPPAS